MKKPNLSRIFYQKYFHLSNDMIRVTLKNGESITGSIISFVYEDMTDKDSAIYAWHIVNEADKLSLGIDNFGLTLGWVVYQKEIATVYFFEDNSIFQF